MTIAQAVEIIVVSYLVILPFTLKFDTMFQGVGIAQYHSMIHQLLILWGLPAVLTVLLIICILWEKLRGGQNTGIVPADESALISRIFSLLSWDCVP